MAHPINPSNTDREASRSLSLMPGWSTEQIPGESGLHKETQTKSKQQQIADENCTHCILKGEVILGALQDSLLRKQKSPEVS